MTDFEVTTSPAGYKVIKTDALGIRLISAVGGFCVAAAHPETVKLFDGSGLAVGEKYILASKQMANLLGRDGFEAVIGHEEGHCALGHSEGAPGEIPNVIENELEADAYGAALTSKAAMRKSLAVMLRITARLNSIDKKMLARIPGIKARFDALK